MPLEDYDVVIGLEVHAQLLTDSKLFDGASTSFGAEPNANTQAYCLALPGTLPVPNARAVEFAMRAGLALDCRVNETSEWSRKHYFYPDLPKGYQITQYEFPICEHGHLTVTGADGAEKKIRIRRIHLEEDAGKLIHEAAASLVDLNRAGTPLVEIVSDPDLSTADEAVEYLKALREVLVAVGVNDGNLEEGSFRCDANVSVKKRGTIELGTRCELKNLNSFRFIKQAIEVEAQRHVELIESGQKVEQETRLFDPHRGETRSMRSKEEAQDYRYFPDPDLPPLRLSPAAIEAARASLPELPRARRQRYVSRLGLPAYDAGVLTAEPPLADLFDACVAAGADAKQVSNWLMGELSRLLKASGKSAAQVAFTPSQLKALIDAVAAGTVSGPGAKQVFEVMFETGREPAAVIAEQGLAQVSDDAVLEAAIDAAIAASPENVERYQAGNDKLMSYFVGQAMKALKGKGNPRRLSELLKKKLSGA